MRAGALVSLCAVGPFVAQRASAQAGDRERRTGQVHVVTGGEHDAVQVVLDAVAGAKAHRAQCRDGPVDQLAVVALQRGVVVAGDQHALAARGEVGRELAAQPRVFDLTVQVHPAEPGHHRGQRGVPHQRRRAGLVAPIQRLARKLLHRRSFGEHRLDSRRRREIEAGEHPARGALEYLHEIGLLDQFGDDLDRAGAGADDTDPLSGEVVILVPAGTVNLVALVGVDAPDVGEAGVGQRPGRQDHRAGAKTLAAGRGCGPGAGVLVEGQSGDFVAELECGDGCRTDRPCPRCGCGSPRPANRSATRSGS